MIYDCFTFFNELDLLEIRLKILYDCVDKFVLVEADKTHSGKPKPFYFNENKHRFLPYLDKIVHISLDNMPESQNSWVLENFQRNQISRGLIKCNPEDIILISDLDEIPNPDTIRNYIPGSGIYKLIQSFYYYYLNYRCAAVNNKWIPWRKADKWIPWDMARICQFKDIRSDIETIRTGWQYMTRPQIMNGGWHFSYLGGIEKIIEKIEAFAHQEYNNDYFKDKSRLTKALEKNKDLYDRTYKFIKVPIDEHYPRYVQDNIPLLKEKGLIL